MTSSRSSGRFDSFRSRLIPASRRRRLVRHVSCAALLSAAVAMIGACSPANLRPWPTAESDAQATARYLASIQDQPLRLLGFMRAMPKGADLHNHLSGAVYAEDFLRWAATDGDCIDRRTDTLSAPPCDAAHGIVPVARAQHDTLLYRQVIDAWSMRDFVSSAGDSGHDHFFDSFDKFHRAAHGHMGDMLAVTQREAAQQHIAYLELMVTPGYTAVKQLSDSVHFDPDLARLRAALQPGLAAAVDAAREKIDQAEVARTAELHCAAAQPDSGCAVQVRFLYQVLRGLAPQLVFAQMLTGFELAAHDPRVVGLNLVMAEDGYTAMHDFNLHMAMLDYLHGLYPTVKISLHAGELAPGMVPPDGLRFHIRASIERGHAQRIGHGVDVMYENHPRALLREMAQRHILVEICPTSNHTILGIAGERHPLPLYLAAQVPVAIATDDAGVSRSTLSREFVAVERDFHLPWSTLKKMVRDSLEYAFVSGTSLWADPARFRPVAACAGSAPGTANPPAACAGFLGGSGKARLQWRTEAALRAFEAKIARY